MSYHYQLYVVFQGFIKLKKNPDENRALKCVFILIYREEGREMERWKR